MAILAVNAGSSTLKFAVYPVADGLVGAAGLNGSIQGLEPGGQPQIGWRWQGRNHERQLSLDGESPFTAALRQLAELLTQQHDLPPIHAVAHRVVHGGRDFSGSVIVTDEVLQRLDRLNSLAPLHQPHNLQGIRAFRAAFPQLPQVACFDTAFHSSIDELDQRFALPASLLTEGVRRYGFHGLSYHFIRDTLAVLSPRASGRLLMAHLGNGASLCAALEGRSIASSMGFSALDGLMMGTRCGSLDAGVLLYLLEQGWTHDRLQTLLYKQSGLLGVSGLSADMRRLRADESQPARDAVTLFTRRVVRECGAMVACLQGLDLLAFSGGIGENDQRLRADVCAQLAWLGLRLDPQANEASGDEPRPLHAPDSTIEVWVVPTDEGRVAAREALALIV